MPLSIDTGAGMDSCSGSIAGNGQGTGSVSGNVFLDFLDLTLFGLQTDELDNSGFGTGLDLLTAFLDSSSKGIPAGVTALGARAREVVDDCPTPCIVDLAF